MIAKDTLEEGDEVGNDNDGSGERDAVPANVDNG